MAYVLLYKACSKLASSRLITCWLKSCSTFSRARLTTRANSSVSSWLNAASRCASARASFSGTSQPDLSASTSSGIPAMQSGNYWNTDRHRFHQRYRNAFHITIRTCNRWQQEDIRVVEHRFHFMARFKAVSPPHLPVDIVR